MAADVERIAGAYGISRDGDGGAGGGGAADVATLRGTLSRALGQGQRHGQRERGQQEGTS
jgi:hypothetical protein